MTDVTTIAVEAPVKDTNPLLTEEQILAAATNLPALSPDQFKLGDRVFKIVHLPYDDYVTFLGYLQPFLAALVNKKSAAVSIPGINLGASADPGALLQFCSGDLPEMVRLIAKQSEPDISIREIKDLAGNPFVLAGVVIQQLARNQMIGDFVSFFKQVTPLLALAK